MSAAGGRRDVYGLELAGEDDAFAAREATCAATGVEVVAPGLATARGVDADRLRTLAYTHRASRLLGRSEASVDAARAVMLDADVMEVLDVTAFGTIWNTLVPSLAVLIVLDVILGAVAVYMINRASSASVQ